MTKPTASIDEHGNALLEVDPNSMVGQLVALLEYGRRRGFRIGPFVQIGDVRLQVQDLRQDRDEGRSVELPPDAGPWAAQGVDEDGDR